VDQRDGAPFQFARNWRALPIFDAVLARERSTRSGLRVHLTKRGNQLSHAIAIYDPAVILTGGQCIEEALGSNSRDRVVVEVGLQVPPDALDGLVFCISNE
jgi:hypothetical protein